VRRMAGSEAEQERTVAAVSAGASHTVALLCKSEELLFLLPLAPGGTSLLASKANVARRLEA